MRITSITALLACLALSSCVSIRLGPDEDFLRVKGLANVYGTVGGLDDWDGKTFLDFGLFSNTRGRNEIVSVEVGPLAGVGVGLLGARARVLPLEIGVGTLFYNPRPRKRIQVEETEIDGVEVIEEEHQNTRVAEKSRNLEEGQENKSGI